MDVNKIAAEFLQNRLDTVFDFASSRVKRVKDSIRAKISRTYKNYLTRVLERYSRGKSFFVRSDAIPLYDFFVPLDLATETTVLRKPGATDIAALSPNVILIGTGGSGKTMMMRHLLVSALRSKSRTPVFYELRHQNVARQPLRIALLEALQSYGLEADDNYLELALKAGHFDVMLDGFDELNRKLKRDIANEVQDLAARYPGNWITVSSRPDPILEGWDTFTHLRVQPLDLPTAAELVRKLPFDDPVKGQFVEAIRGGLFERHKSFLSNPLLLSIMVLTYTDIATIPSKLSVFYTQAYEALFQRHDALKGGFQRERRSGLDIQDFARAFSAFCVLTYEKRAFAFPPIAALDFLSQGKRLSQLAYDSEAILHDATQAVCLLVEEGMDLTFSHRSFQEYFVARFVSTCPPGLKGDLIRLFAPSIGSDSVMSLLFELDQHAVESTYILPSIARLRRRLRIKGSVGITHFLRYLKAVYSSFTLEPNGGVTAVIRDVPLFLAVRFVQRHCHVEPVLGSETSRVDPIQFKSAFEAAFTARSVQTKSLSTTNSFVRWLYGSPGYWGPQEIRDVLSAENDINRRHSESRQSIETLLAARPPQPAQHN